MHRDPMCYGHVGIHSVVTLTSSPQAPRLLSTLRASTSTTLGKHTRARHFILVPSRHCVRPRAPRSINKRARHFTVPHESAAVALWPARLTCSSSLLQSSFRGKTQPESSGSASKSMANGSECARQLSSHLAHSIAAHSTCVSSLPRHSHARALPCEAAPVKLLGNL